MSKQSDEKREKYILLRSAGIPEKEAMRMENVYKRTVKYWGLDEDNLNVNVGDQIQAAASIYVQNLTMILENDRKLLSKGYDDLTDGQWRYITERLKIYKPGELSQVNSIVYNKKKKKKNWSQQKNGFDTEETDFAEMILERNKNAEGENFNTEEPQPEGGITE